jgi:hypothetical protein
MMRWAWYLLSKGGPLQEISLSQRQSTVVVTDIAAFLRPMHLTSLSVELLFPALSERELSRNEIERQRTLDWYLG